MFDRHINEVTEPAKRFLAKYLLQSGLHKDDLTLIGFGFGLLCVPFLAMQLYVPALICLIVNRVLDGLDGAMARLTKPTASGAYLDIVLDFVFYSAFVMGVVLGLPEQGHYGAFLIFSFVANGSAFLAYAIYAEKLKLEEGEPTTDSAAKKGFAFIGGLAEGFETFVVFVLICLLPDQFWLIAIGFGTLCLVSAGQRIYYSYREIAKSELGPRLDDQ